MVAEFKCFPKLQFLGDKVRAKKLWRRGVFEFNVLVGLMEQSPRKLKQSKRRTYFTDGTIINCNKYFNEGFVSIFVPVIEEVITKEGFDLGPKYVIIIFHADQREDAVQIDSLPDFDKFVLVYDIVNNEVPNGIPKNGEGNGYATIPALLSEVSDWVYDDSDIKALFSNFEDCPVTTVGTFTGVPEYSLDMSGPDGSGSSDYDFQCFDVATGILKDFTNTASYAKSSGTGFLDIEIDEDIQRYGKWPASNTSIYSGNVESSYCYDLGVKARGGWEYYSIRHAERHDSFVARTWYNSTRETEETFGFKCNIGQEQIICTQDHYHATTGWVNTYDAVLNTETTNEILSSTPYYTSMLLGGMWKGVNPINVPVVQLYLGYRTKITEHWTTYYACCGPEYPCPPNPAGFPGCGEDATSKLDTFEYSVPHKEWNIILAAATPNVENLATFDWRGQQRNGGLESAMHRALEYARSIFTFTANNQHMHWYVSDVRMK